MASARVVPDFPAWEDPPDFTPPDPSTLHPGVKKLSPLPATGLSVLALRQFTVWPNRGLS